MPGRRGDEKSRSRPPGRCVIGVTISVKREPWNWPRAIPQARVDESPATSPAPSPHSRRRNRKATVRVNLGGGGLVLGRELADAVLRIAGAKQSSIHKQAAALRLVEMLGTSLWTTGEDFRPREAGASYSGRFRPGELSQSFM